MGFLLGMAFLLLMDQLVPHLHLGSEKAEGPNSSFKRLTMLVLAVTLHNIPEGMAVGVVFAGMLSGDERNHPHRGLRPVYRHRHPEFPRGGHHLPPAEKRGGQPGAAPSCTACSPEWWSRRAPCSPFCWPLKSPRPSPTSWPSPRGAMLYVVVEELIPEASQGEHSNLGTIGFAVGFTLMMILDVALG